VHRNGICCVPHESLEKYGLRTKTSGILRAAHSFHRL